MEIVRDIEQGTQEWLDIRSGLLSASKADVLVTPTGKVATGQKVTDYMNKLIAERMMGKSAESGFMSDAMQRGIELEEDARDWYSMATGEDVEEVTIVRDGDYSCSPDGLIFDGENIDKGLEIKCPLAHTHVGYLRAGKVPTKYIPQLQMSMFVCDVNEWDFLSYHPDIEPLLITVQRDQEWIDLYRSKSKDFIKDMDEALLSITPHTNAAA